MPHILVSSSKNGKPISKMAHLYHSSYLLNSGLSQSSLLLRYLCSNSSDIPPASSKSEEIKGPHSSVTEEPVSSMEAEKIPPRIPRGKLRAPEKTEDLICRMMSKRPWTTRLQNSIRNLVPEFDTSLVWNVLHGARKPEQALQFFRWVERTGFRHDLSTCTKMVRILGYSSMLNHARCIVFDMTKKGIDLNEELFVVLIDSYGKAGIVQESVKMFQTMKALGIERTTLSYDIFFKVILRRGRYLMAKRYFNAMIRDGIMPTRQTFNILIWGFFLSLREKTASRFFDEMKKRGISPNEVTYNTLINGYLRFKKIDDAERIFAEMKENNVVPNVITYTTMIKGYISCNRVEDGWKFYGEMIANGIEPSNLTYSTILPGLSDANKLVEARGVLKEMANKHVSPSDESIFLKLISAHCKCGELDGAHEVLKMMARLHVPTEPAHYGLLIENFCKAGKYERAIYLLDKLIEKEIVLNPRSTSEIEPSAYNPVIEYLCNNGQTQKAENFFRQLMKTGVTDSIAFNNLIQGHSKDGSPESALELIKIMNRRNVATDYNAYVSLVESFLRKNEPADAKIALDGMIEKGHLPSSALFQSLMESLFNDGRVQTASRVMKSMVEKGVKENMDIVARILEALLIRGHVEEAIARIDLLIGNGHVPDFDNLLTVLCEKHKTIPALKLVDYGLSRDCNISFSIYDRVLDALCSAGKTLNAYSILCKIMEKGGITDRRGIEGLIKSLNEEGNTKQADNLSRMFLSKLSRRKKGSKTSLDA